MADARKDLRNKIFSQPKRKEVIVNINGAEIALRQPSVGQLLQMQENTDNTDAFINMMLEYAYVPGTDEKVFEKEDVAVIMEWPVESWFTQVGTAFAELTSLDVETAEKN